jgi:hypothetical protein
MTRSAGENPLETKEIHLENDLFLYATLRPDPDALRAGTEEALVANQRVYLRAYNQGTASLVAGAEYTYTGGKLVPDGGSPLGVNAGTYDFVAYSHYKSATDPVTTNIDPVNDLIWGRQPDRQIGATSSDADRTVTVKMEHLFSQVKVKVNVGGIANAVIMSPIGARVEGGYRRSLSIYNGQLSGGSALQQPLTWSGTLPAAMTTSDALVVTPVADPTKARITITNLNIRIGSGTYTYHGFDNFVVEFDHSLDAGTSYLLELNVKRERWARSNIYWEGGKLRFDSIPTAENKYYWGAVFKWGSLVGIALNISYQKPSSNMYIDLYVPNPGTKYWSQVQLGSIGTTYLDGDYTAIPYTISGNSSNKGANYLYENSDYENYLGDICSYLTDGAWRMPNADEFGSSSNYSAWINGGSPIGGATILNNQLATLNGRIYNPASLFFPATGYRVETSTLGTETVYGNMNDMGSRAYYWSGSANGSGYAWNLRLDQSGTGIYSSVLTNAYPVRCIRKLPTE